MSSPHPVSRRRLTGTHHDKPPVGICCTYHPTGGLRLQGEVGDGVAEVLVEAGGERAEEEITINLGADITKLIRQRLETTTVVIN